MPPRLYNRIFILLFSDHLNRTKNYYNQFANNTAANKEEGNGRYPSPLMKDKKGHKKLASSHYCPDNQTHTCTHHGCRFLKVRRSASQKMVSFTSVRYWPMSPASTKVREAALGCEFN